VKIALAAIALSASLAVSGCVYCPWLAKAGDVGECEGNLLDNLDGQAYRLTRIKAGASRTHSLTMQIDRDECSISPGSDLSSLDVLGLRIINPRSAETATVILTTTLKDRKEDQVKCTAPLAEFDAMEFVCPPAAGDLKYVLGPVR
jgi:hypothetical protein